MHYLHGVRSAAPHTECSCVGVEMVKDLVLQSRISAHQIPAVAELMDSGSLTFLEVLLMSCAWPLPPSVH